MRLHFFSLMSNVTANAGTMIGDIVTGRQPVVDHGVEDIVIHFGVDVVTALVANTMRT